MIRLEMKNYNDINRETAKIHKYECLTGDDILSSNQQQIIE